MSSPSSMSCVLIGGDTLLAACGDTILARGGRLSAVMSRARIVHEWARKHGIQVMEPTRAAATELALVDFEHLFSIAHLSVVPAEILGLARGERINFHDAPLPRLAGLNTPNWAILQGESEHGVTWHRMTAGVDEGDILAQELFAIDADETALSLNTKCFEAGLRTFAGLLDQMEQGSLAPRAQDLAQRRYCSRGDRISGFIDWTKSAAEIERLVRALDTGPYKNPFAAPTISDGRVTWIVKRARISSEPCRAAPGMLMPSSEQELLVATGNGTLALVECRDLAGRNVSPQEIRAQIAASTGRFDVLAPDLARRLEASSGDLGRAENFWTTRLASLSSIELPFLAAPVSDASRIERVTLPSAVKLVARYRDRSAEAVLTAAITAWVARLSGRSTFDVDWSNPTLRGRSADLERWVSPSVPAHFDVRLDRGFDAWLSDVELELAHIAKRGSFLHDVVARYPALSSDAQLTHGFALPTAIEHVERPGEGVRRTDASVSFIAAKNGECELVYDSTRMEPDSVVSLRDSFAAFIAGIVAEPEHALNRVALLGTGEREKLLVRFNATERGRPREPSVHVAIEAACDNTPRAPAVSCGDEQITYHELDERSNRLAAHLRALGAGPGTIVGVCLERSIDLVVAVVAVLKSDAAYLPLDPSFPEERTCFMLADSGATHVIAQCSTLARVSHAGASVVCIDEDTVAIERRSNARIVGRAHASDLAYVIYTSGSTGQPKGVMVEHGNVLNFFVGMDACVPHDPPGTWLAVTSLSFDISVLELLWTLARGFHVVVHQGRSATQPRAQVAATKPLEFSLFYFASDETKQGADKYRLLLEGAKFADENGFAAVWTPERHFHAFGGLYPAPAVTAAALATITKHVSIRAGSVVMPLNDPIRVAEAWSVVDNLSNGRVGISFASGWQPNDFVLAPGNFARAKHVMFESLDVVQRLWRGETVAFPGPKDDTVDVRTLPRPVQAELPTWITTAGNPETYVQAGRIGANLLTHLLGQSIEELTPKIEMYRRARAEAGHDPATGTVTLMLHTFVAERGVDVRGIVRGPLRNYLGTSLDLLKKYAWAFPAFKKPANGAQSAGDELDALSEEERDAVLEHAFERYFETSGLFGAPEECVAFVERLRAIGVSEIACLIDFGVPFDDALSSLPALKRLHSLVTHSVITPNDSESVHETTIAGDIRRHRVTHMQCTPSMARMLCLDPDARAQLWNVPHLMIGGEAFPASLAHELAHFPGEITNMYGPTETTIWSSTHVIEKGAASVPIGCPIANTQLHVLDAQHQLLPTGVAGELWIGGYGVARGYHARPELTAERFTIDPFRVSDGARMYRTGDLVRRRHDGVVEFLGRIDHQVKVRGYRIELGEIEALMGTHKSVREAVVVASADAHGESRLVAYFVPRSTAPANDELRDFLRTKLPEYMVPGWFVPLQRLPLTPNGKVDRKALPAPEASAPIEKRASFVAPASEMEGKLALLWQEILGLERVGIDDNFFDVGGHSLLVVRMHRKIGDIVDRPVSLTDLYRFSTIRSFAEWIGSNGASKTLDVGAERGTRRRDALLRRRRE